MLRLLNSSLRLDVAPETFSFQIEQNFEQFSYIDQILIAIQASNEKNYKIYYHKIKYHWTVFFLPKLIVSNH